MALTATQLRALLKANLHNDTTFTDPDDLNTFLTLGQARIVRDAPHVLGVKEASLSLTVAAGREYSLASDFYQMRAIWYQTSGYALEAVPFSRFIDEVERLPTIPSGPPQSYTITGYSVADSAIKLRVDKTPAETMTVEYWYYWMPADISGATTPAISAIGFGELILWAGTMIARERNDPDGFIQAAGIYERILGEYQSYDPTRPDRASVVRNPALDMRGGGSTLRMPPEFPA